MLCEMAQYIFYFAVVMYLYESEAHFEKNSSLYLSHLKEPTSFKFDAFLWGHIFLKTTVLPSFDVSL